MISGLAFATLGFFKEGCYGALKGAALGTVLSLSSLGLWSKFFSETAIVQKALERHNAAAQFIYVNAISYLKSKTNEPKIFIHGVLEKGEHKTLEAQARILYDRDIMMTACRNYYESCKPPEKKYY